MLAALTTFEFERATTHMADQPTRVPIAGLITDAQEGRLSLKMDPDKFAEIEYACIQFHENVIQAIQDQLRAVSLMSSFGFGDDSGSALTSASTMARRFREISEGNAGNNFFDVLQEHALIVEQLRQIFAVVRDRYLAQDQGLADQFRVKLAELEQRSQSKPQPSDQFWRFEQNLGEAK